MSTICNHCVGFWSHSLHSSRRESQRMGRRKTSFNTFRPNSLLPMITFYFMISLNLRCTDKWKTVSLGVATKETTVLIGSIVRYAGRQIGKNVHAHFSPIKIFYSPSGEPAEDSVTRCSKAFHSRRKIVVKRSIGVAYLSSLMIWKQHSNI